jgi:hypothetical protein
MTLSSTGECCSMPGGFVKTISISRVHTLTKEDKEEAAQARLVAGLTWSAWKGADQVLCDGCCTASWEFRLTGRNWYYQECEWRFHRTDLLPETHYKVTITFERKVYVAAEDTWEQYDTRVLEFDTPAAAPGQTTVEHTESGGTVPNQRGYSTRARACVKTEQ